MKIAIAGYGVVGRGAHELLLKIHARHRRPPGRGAYGQVRPRPEDLTGTPGEGLKAAGIGEGAGRPGRSGCWWRPSAA